jgi:hypothetical protein
VSEANIVGTGRNQTLVDAVITEVALRSGLRFRVERYCVVVALLDAELTSVALVGIEYHDTILPFGDGFFGTSVSAGRILAVDTHIGSKAEVELPVDRLGPVLGYVDELVLVIVFLVAGELAGPASPT